MAAKATSSFKHHSRPRNLPAIKDEGSDWYQGWYFDLRLEEELARAKRYNLPLSLLRIYLIGPAVKERDHNLLNELLSDVVSRKLRRMDIPAFLEGNEYAVALPHTNQQQAEVVAKRLTKAFAPYSVAAGVASFPQDGLQPEQLLVEAGQRALASTTNGAGATKPALRELRSGRRA